jgi:hypothetical protein
MTCQTASWMGVRAGGLMPHRLAVGWRRAGIGDPAGGGRRRVRAGSCGTGVGLVKAGAGVLSRRACSAMMRAQRSGASHGTVSLMVSPSLAGSIRNVCQDIGLIGWYVLNNPPGNGQSGASPDAGPGAYPAFISARVLTWNSRVGISKEIPRERCARRAGGVPSG